MAPATPSKANMPLLSPPPHRKTQEQASVDASAADLKTFQDKLRERGRTCYVCGELILGSGISTENYWQQLLAPILDLDRELREAHGDGQYGCCCMFPS